MPKKQQIRHFFDLYCEYAVQFVLITLEMQLFLSCMYIPILTYWGLSWPLLSVISTPIFTPLFILFLIASSLIFFNALFCESVFPFFIVILEWITATWVFILSAQPFNYQLGFCLPPIAFLFLLPSFALYIVSRSCSRMYKIFYLSVSIFLFYGITVLIGLTKSSCHLIETDRGSFHLVLCNGKKIIVDSGGWKKAVPYPSWFFYTLMPAITKSSGATTIDAWIIISNKNNFSRFVDAILLVTPHALIVTHEKNYAQLGDQKKHVFCLVHSFVLDELYFLLDKKKVTICLQEKVVFQGLIT